MRIYLDQAGCRLNYSEMETLGRRLRAVGHQTVDEPGAAQVIVFNSCAVTTEAASKSRQRVRQLHKQNHIARIAVTGCLATLDPQKVAALPGVALVAGNQRKDMLHLLLEPWSAELDGPEQLARMQPDGDPFSGLYAEPDGESTQVSRTRSFIKVQDGCDNRCTFCVVTLARGQGRSRGLDELVDEVQACAQSGVREAVLTGVHLGSYGRDLPGAQRSDLKALTSVLLTHTDIPRVRLSSLEPWELAPGFFDLWSRWPDRLCPHLHLPLQAGTDRQLRRMARRCTVDSYRALVREARAVIPNLILTTDLIAGFPGETETDFEQGLAYVEELRFADAHIFPFSARAGTAAAGFSGQIPNRVKKARARRLYAVVERTGRAERMAHVGTCRPVLWERPRHTLEDRMADPRDAASSDRVDARAATNAEARNGEYRLWTGFTDNYLRVMLEAPQELELHNRIMATRLVGLDGDTLVGEV